MADAFENLGWGTKEDEWSLVKGTVSDALASIDTVSEAKQIDHVTGRVKTALEMVGMRPTREEARLIAVKALELIRAEFE